MAIQTHQEGQIWKCHKPVEIPSFLARASHNMAVHMLNEQWLSTLRARDASIATCAAAAILWSAFRASGWVGSLSCSKRHNESLIALSRCESAASASDVSTSRVDVSNVDSTCIKIPPEYNLLMSACRCICKRQEGHAISKLQPQQWIHALFCSTMRHTSERAGMQHFEALLCKSKRFTMEVPHVHNREQSAHWGWTDMDPETALIHLRSREAGSFSMFWSCKRR